MVLRAITMALGAAGIAALLATLVAFGFGQIERFAGVAALVRFALMFGVIGLSASVRCSG